MRAPTFGGKKESVGSKAEGAFVLQARKKIGGEAEGVRCGDAPGLGKSELDVARIGGRRLEGEGLGVPLRAGFGVVKTVASGQANFDQGERSAAIIAKTIFGFEVNDGLWVRSELNADFLLFDEIAGAAGGVAA